MIPIRIPYDRWTLIGLKQTPFYAPFSGMMKPYFDSLARAPGISSPLLCLIGSEDVFVSPELSLRIVDAWGGTTKVINYPNEGHDLLFQDNNSWMDIVEFLNTVRYNSAIKGRKNVAINFNHPHQ